MRLLSRLRTQDTAQKQKPRVNGHQRGLTSESSSASEFLAASYSSYSSQDSPKGTDHLPAESPQKKPPPMLAQQSPIELPKRISSSTRIEPHMPGTFVPSARGHARSPNGSDSFPHDQQPMSGAARPYSSYGPPKNRTFQGFAQPPPGVPRAVSEVSLSETDYSGSDINSGTEYDDDLEYNAAQNHPYYSQWKQYYQAMALYQALMAQKQGAANRNSMYPGTVPTSRTPSASTSFSPSRPLSVANYYVGNGEEVTPSDNNLLRNSRRCTLKSSRSASVPLLYPMGEAGKPSNRSVSANLTAPVSNPITPTEEDIADIGSDKPTQSVLVAPSTKLIIHNLHDMVLEPTETRQISDYGAFLDVDDDTPEPVPEAQKVIPEKPKVKTQTYSSDEEEVLQDLEVYSLPPDSPQKSVRIGLEPPRQVENLNRQHSNASTSSYNSLQSEKNFFVSKTPNRVATIVSRKLSRASEHGTNTAPTFVPPMPGPPPPIFTNTPREVADMSMPYTPGTDLHRHSMINLNGANQMFLPQQQQYHPQMRPMRPYLVYQPQPAPQVAGPFSSDPVINQRIDEFISLRRIIALGNKTLEFRLKWMKMLLIATNYKLYSYINVKGGGISPDQVMANKHLFIKAFVSHLQKLLRELDANRDSRKNKTFAEVCYIQGCLYMNDHVEKFGQDFGFERDDAEAERFLQHCVELDPSYFRAYYKLGELYESHETEEKFDMALEQYKESALMGYNKAIYKVAIIFLFVPKVRLVRFYKYLKELANIDMESTDIQLEGPDRDELEEIVGLALFQLGKVHEGIYPGDLTLQDEFVQEATSIAKVDYAKSLSYYNRAAKLHCLEAQVRLGRIYELGELNRKPNANKSIQWYIKATTSPLKFKRHPEAMLGVSRWFLKGSNGTSKHIPYPNPEAAIMWCERACKEFKYPEAYYQMGLLVEGDFVDGDAYEWFAEASQLGHLEAQAKIRN